MVALAVGGVSIGWFLGARSPLLLAGFSVLGASAVRTLTFLGLTVTPWNVPSASVWLGVQISLFAVALIVSWRSRELWNGWALAMAMVGMSLLLKFPLGIGERHHSDSATMVAIATLVLQNDEVSGNAKRGLTYPLLLALGAEGAILSSVTVYIFLGLLATIGWAFMRVREAIQPGNGFGLVVLGVVAISLSTPMIRIIPFYMNGHTLVALALLAILVVFVRTVVSQDRFSRLDFGLLALAGFVAGTTRIEAFILFILLFLTLTSNRHVLHPRAILIWPTLVTIPASSTLLWFLWAEANPFPFSLDLAWVALAGSILITVWLYSPAGRALRPYLPVAISAALFATFLFVLVADEQRSSVLAGLVSTIENVLLGGGGWGYFFPAMLALLFIVGLRGTSTAVVRLWLGSITAVLFTLLIKYVERGSFGGTVFWDTINRSWIHVLPLVMLLVGVSLAELLARSPSFLGRELPSERAAPNRV